MKVQATALGQKSGLFAMCPTLFPRPNLSTAETLPTDPVHCEGPADRLDSLHFLRHLLSGVGGESPHEIKGTSEEAGGQPHRIRGLPSRR